MYDTAVEDDTPFAVEIEVMRHMRWSWADLMQTPADVVDAIIERITAEGYWRVQAAKRQAAQRKAAA